MPAIRIAEFDTWREGYGLASVRVLQAGTSVLATVYSDEELTDEVANPITLNERILDGSSFGKFAAPVYVGVPYELEINSVDRTGVSRPPLTSLDGQDASEAVATVAGGEVAVALKDSLARVIHVKDYGIFLAAGESGVSASTNNATLATAIGVAGARGGGVVEVPAGTFPFNNLTIPQGVVLKGSGRGATILQSLHAGEVITLGGARAGLSRLTLDGITLVVNSVGVYAVNKDESVFDDCEIKRFETGLYRKGGSRIQRRELYISNCVNGAKEHGDLAAGSGAALMHNTWLGGKIDLCSALGLELKNVDAECSHSVLSDILFKDNTGTALKIVGARKTTLHDCRFAGNTVSINAADGAPVTTSNTVIGLGINGGAIKNGTIVLSGTLEAVAFRRVDLESVAFTFTTPSNNILAQDCREVTGVTFAGVATAWVRHKSGDIGASEGLTTGSTATKAWSIALEPGQRVYLVAKVIGRQRNDTDDAFYHFAVSARRPGATLAYDSQTANFTAGDVLTGSTSGATARITDDTDAGSTGTLTLQDVVGTFVDNEIITSSSGGSALANGAIATSNAALAGTVTDIRPVQETVAGWAATFVANGPEIELRVTGATGDTVEWIADVSVVSS
jgi:hypothetical protein